ncbi:unnamed protein product [Meganyctiphanes norvegica]|uniref:XRRM domain-containing protein n=1 Tax=Meganyctiphanes norvegica TaxID=48144 RepID=A0AAV2Q2A7_MEGNR
MMEHDKVEQQALSNDTLSWGTKQSATKIRQVVRKKVMTTPQHEEEPQQYIEQPQRHRPIKVVKRSGTSSSSSSSAEVGSSYSQSGGSGRHVLSSGESSSGVLRRIGSSGSVRRVVTASSGTSVPQITPTTCAVKLRGMPTDLSASEIKKLINDAGVGRAKSVLYTRGSSECVVRFSKPESAAQFFQKYNRKMYGMNVIRAKMVE